MLIRVTPISVYIIMHMKKPDAAFTAVKYCRDMSANPPYRQEPSLNTCM